MGSRFQNSLQSNFDQTAKISKSVFISNFPDDCSSRDLWKVCSGYGTVVDVFIPNKRSKAGKRFAFVRFIKVLNFDRLIENLKTIWIGRFHLSANPARFERPKAPIPQKKMSAPSGIASGLKQPIAQHQGILGMVVMVEVLYFLSINNLQGRVFWNSCQANFLFGPSFQRCSEQELCSDDESIKANRVMEDTVPADVYSSPVGSKPIHGSHKGGSLLEVLDGMIKVGQTMGFSMDGCLKDMEIIIVIITGFLLSRWNGDVLVTGDFNEVRFEKERLGSVFNVHGANEFNSFISNARLVEIQLEGYSLTWSHPSAAKMIQGGVSDDDSSFRLDVDETNCKIFKSTAVSDQMRKAKISGLFEGDGTPIFSWFPSRLTADQISDLEKPVSSDEIRKAVWSCGKNIGIPLVQIWVLFFVNGSPTSEFQFHCGLKQGDPLAPYLFILVMESLHLSVSRTVEAGIFTGIKIDSALSISHLFYADDAVFIGEWTDSNLRSIIQMLHCFSLASGLKINLQKSNLLGVGVTGSLVNEAAASIGCSVMKERPLFKNLGVMVGGNMSKINAWDDMVGKIKSRLSKWKINTLSIGGRLTLLKVVLGSTPIYPMSLYKVSKTVLHEMESFVVKKNFFNGVQGVDRKFRGFKVDESMQTRFWEDLWLGEVPFNELFPRLYALENNKECSVAVKMQGEIDRLSFSHHVREVWKLSRSKTCRIWLGRRVLSNVDVDGLGLNGDGWGPFVVKDARDLGGRAISRLYVDGCGNVLGACWFYIRLVGL
ncbi:RNA-directed DNA polymerase, eukaryota [Tanacetum coccineum]|uniref:RNA-directed DNA polymerase, eukaryota n=1 Tax=Tanacetum coccineum TaxID=301880 RepID=A0ABQ4ZN05_9ASTR